jgi:phosphoribosylformylglycinamidine (FGAM) synthase PurS component
MKLRQALNEGKMVEKVLKKLNDHHVEEVKRGKALRIIIRRMIDSINDTADLQDIHNSLDLNNDLESDVAGMLYNRGGKLGTKI